ncbi:MULTISPECIES: hypothetical protein [Clostridium]|uniref:Uncharacterized protein n=1 Tax=Clostridium disporicum TaxID=84024 RepID=A0A173XSJ2_9CLOT|nr:MULTISPECIES: hypothetical protein [Clostridium]CUN54639.1 Uncharacterised protein [Clostridium disporicum]
MCKEESKNVIQMDEIIEVEKVDVKEDNKDDKIREYEDLLGY